MIKRLLDNKEALSKCPIKHISPSAIREYLTDRRSFFRKYVLYIYDDREPIALVMGNAYHLAIEEYWIAKMNGEPVVLERLHDTARAYLIERDTQYDVSYGVKWDIDKSIDYVENMISAYVEVGINYSPVEVEQKINTLCESNDGLQMPVKIKGKIDLEVIITEDMLENDPIYAGLEVGMRGFVDHKTATVLPSRITPAMEVQACSYYYLGKQKYGKPINFMIFDSVSKTKTPKFNRLIIKFDDAMLKRFEYLYAGVIAEMCGLPMVDENGRFILLPNPYQQFGAEESWQDFVDEMAGLKAPITYDLVNDVKADNKKEDLALDLDL